MYFKNRTSTKKKKVIKNLSFLKVNIRREAGFIHLDRYRHFYKPRGEKCLATATKLQRKCAATASPLACDSSIFTYPTLVSTLRVNTIERTDMYAS